MVGSPPVDDPIFFTLSPQKARGNLEGVGGGRGRRGSYDLSSLSSEDNIMKFGDTIHNRVDHRSQKDFSPGGTLSGDFSTLTDLGQIWKKMWEVNFRNP